MVGEGFRQIPYAGGQKVVVSETGGTVQGEPPRFLVFGGYNAECKEEYTRKTFLIEGTSLPASRYKSSFISHPKKWNPIGVLPRLLG